jgi:hypothetical protein
LRRGGSFEKATAQEELPNQRPNPRINAARNLIVFILTRFKKYQIPGICYGFLGTQKGQKLMLV